MNFPIKQEGLSYKNVPMAAHGGGGMLMPQTFGEVVAFSEIMARSQHAIPKHLRDVPGACLAVTMQAMRWEMDPFAVASKSYNVKDIIAYEAQLIAAVVHTRAPLKTRPVYNYAGEGQDRRCTVTALFDDGIERSYESPRIAEITTKNSPLWKADQDQQQGYYSIRAFARRYCPEVILGVYTPEEAQSFQGPDNARDVTPRGAGIPISQRLAEIEHRTEAQREAGNRTPPPASAGDEPLTSEQGSAAADRGEAQDRSESASPTLSNSSHASSPGREMDKPAAEAPPPAAGDQSEAKATEGKAGTAEVDDDLVRRSTAGTGLQVGEASADLPATSEAMDATAEETAPSLPQGWEFSLADVLRNRPRQKESVRKYAKQYFENIGAFPATPVDIETAKSIRKIFDDHFGNPTAREDALRELI